MATGTSGGLLVNLDENAQSLFKHELLSHYLETFTSMTGSTAPGRRVVVLDGFAGRGRYPDGRPASAERILQGMVKQRKFRNISAYFVEKDPSDYGVLTEVVAEYAAQGVNGVALRGKVEEHLDKVVTEARGVPLFLFLDPCGAGLRFERLVSVLAGPRAGRRPVTEALLNFSAELSRRVAGVMCAGERKEQRAMDATCGGTWWRQTAEEALEKAPRDLAGKPSFEPVAHAIVERYAHLLAEATDMHPATVPVHRRLGQQPVYHLIFFTRSEYGLWVFAHATALARQAWLRHLGKLDDERDVPALITHTAMKEDLIDQEEAIARSIIAGNLRNLLRRHDCFRLVTQTREVFGEAYGVATEDSVRHVVMELYAAGELRVGRSERPPPQNIRTREMVITRPPGR
ncbi:hypothetical protein GCM10010156_65060 [Planobispora rosea]|uniref:Three-Cys-motif partner protein TcmP n=1 Tax=Planobispora rosea TaxID=35762 RepID=A0A8J3WFU6_PLARO|nr:three-Cys-motif partner protein TcmP [Planobispora rosea]GGS97833.1 hypothetical protein GCM10010156_65060 [Planobispora rosea]GIH87815.1 hypothetical protein Pro02_62230 [Planobispora rosea]